MEPETMPSVELVEPPPRPESRPILHTNGHGAGWSTWHSGSAEQKRFMIGYEPFVRAIEARPRENPRRYGREADEGREVFIAATVRGGRVHFHRLPRDPTFHSPELPPEAGELLWAVGCGDTPADLPLEQFLVDWVRRFGSSSPPTMYAGLRTLSVTRVSGESVVHFDGHDGLEWVRVRFAEEAL